MLNNIGIMDTMTVAQMENHICADEVAAFVLANKEVSMGQILRHFSKNRRNFVWGHIMGTVHDMVNNGKLYMNDRRLISAF